MPDSHRDASLFGEQMAKEPVPSKQQMGIRRLIGIALFALLSVVAVVVITPNRLRRFLPRLPGARSSRARSSRADQEPLPTVQVAWEKLDLSAMPADVARDLQSGKYYYDNRFPGNFGLAISYWKQAQVHASSPDTAGVRLLVASAEGELARQFDVDSGDVVVLLKQGKRDQALALLGKMRADFLDITAPQYRWASAMLYRHPG